MTRQRTKKGAVPEVDLKTIRYQKWVSRAYGFAAACLFGLALAEFFGAASPLLRTLLMFGILAAGTAAWIMQSKRVCPSCGELYGYNIRIVNVNTCAKCGGEFPPWQPGAEDLAPRE